MNARLPMAAAAVLAAGAMAFAGDSEVKVKKLGSAKVRWNQVTYREELMQQLRPGLTWRLGKDGPTRLKIERMALVGRDGILFPGEMTLNLRYWSDTSWQLVVFEEKDWKWNPDYKQLGNFPCTVVQETDPKKSAKALTLELHATSKGERTIPLGPAITGKDAPTPDDEGATQDVEYSDPARRDYDDIPQVELHLRFGPHFGLISFEPAKSQDLKGKLPPAEDSKSKKPSKMRVRYAMLRGVVARTEFLDEWDGELGFATLDQGGPWGQPVSLVLTGGENPTLWPVALKDGKELDEIEGKRVDTGTTPETLLADLDDAVLTVHLDKVDFVFDLASVGR